MSLPLSLTILQGQRSQPPRFLINVLPQSSSLNPTDHHPLTPYVPYTHLLAILYNHLQLLPHGNGGSNNNSLHHPMKISTKNVRYLSFTLTSTAINPQSLDLSPSNPVVFCHGLLGFDSVTIGPAIAPLEVTHWRGIKEVLEQNGTQVLITRVPATSSPVDRAKVLEQKISSVYPGRSVHLIG